MLYIFKTWQIITKHNITTSENDIFLGLSALDFLWEMITSLSIPGGAHVVQTQRINLFINVL